MVSKELKSNIFLIRLFLDDTENRESIMQQYDVSDLIREYFAAFLAQDMKTLEEGLSDDFSFTSPYDDHISKATFF
jgi:ketosteroid isomerase-like protein